MWRVPVPEANRWSADGEQYRDSGSTQRSSLGFLVIKQVIGTLNFLRDRMSEMGTDPDRISLLNKSAHIGHKKLRIYPKIKEVGQISDSNSQESEFNVCSSTSSCWFTLKAWDTIS